MAEILFVDDEPLVLNTIERLFTSYHRTVLKAGSGEEALQLMDDHEVAVLVTDQRMPGMTGTELVNLVKERSPDTVRIILSGYTDLADLLEAVNQGEIFRFLLKPWDDEALIGNVDDALAHYGLLDSRHQAEEATLLALAETIELKDAYTKGHCDRVARYAEGLALELGLPEEVIKEIRYGSWLHDCGKIGTPDEVLNKLMRLSPREIELIKQHPNRGAEVARKARMSERVVQIIRYHHERIDGEGYPAGLKGEEIPLEARIVAVADTFDALSSDRPYRKACNAKQVERIMHDFRGSGLDAELVDLLMERVAPQVKTELMKEAKSRGESPLISNYCVKEQL